MEHGDSDSPTPTLSPGERSDRSLPERRRPFRFDLTARGLSLREPIDGPDCFEAETRIRITATPLKLPLSLASLGERVG